MNIATTLGQDHRQGTGGWAWDLWSAAEVHQRLDHNHMSQNPSNGFASLKSRPFYEQFFLFLHTFSGMQEGQHSLGAETINYTM